MENRIKIDMSKVEDKERIILKNDNIECRMRTYLTANEIQYVVEDTLKYFRELLQSEGDTIALAGAFIRMDMLILALTTNIDVDALGLDDIAKLNLFNVVREINNYRVVRDSVRAGMNLACTNLIIEKLGNIATLDELENTTENIKTELEKDPERMNKLVELMLANNPAIAKELNKNLQEDDE